MDTNESIIDIGEIISLLLSKIVIIVIVSVLFGDSFFAYSKWWIEKEYTSSISIYVSNSEIKEEQKAANADLLAANHLASTYIEILENGDSVYDGISDELLKNHDKSELSKWFTIKSNEGKEYISTSQISSKFKLSVKKDTEVILVQATTVDPKLSAELCTYFSEKAPPFLKDITKVGAVSKIDNAKVPSSPSSPNITKNTMIGILIGAVLSVAVIVIRKLMDKCISTADDIRQRFSIPVLGEIPDIQTDGKEASKYEY